MRYLALACDYDGTLAHHGRMDAATIAALDRVRASGRRLLMVTGRELDDLQSVCPCLDRFDVVVAENGALLYWPGSQREEVLAERPSPVFIEALQARGVSPLSVGRVIVATWEPHETTVLETIHELGLELEIIFNKGAVMVLPAGVTKATGLTAALRALRLSPHNTVGIGDAENDHAFLSRCECAVAVANALPLLKERADFVTQGDHGAGVVELIDALLADDLQSLAPRLQRHDILLGVTDERHEVRLPVYGTTVLVAGPSGSGKSTLAIGVLERLMASGYQVCLIDPEGDYEEFPGLTQLGDGQRAPSVAEVAQFLDQPEGNPGVNLLGLPLQDRPLYLSELLPRLQELRTKTGRPHWIVVDEAHHLLPDAWEPAVQVLPQAPSSVFMVTVHPDMIAPPALKLVDLVIAIGKGADQTLRLFAERAGLPPPALPPTDLAPGQALVWFRRTTAAPVRITIAPSQIEHRRHRRKYALGELPPEQIFFFRGPEGKLNLRVQNLALFNQIAEGIDDETWLYHLRRGDYSRWFRLGIKDDELADEAAAIERQSDLPPIESRARIRQAIERRYTLPA